MKNQFFYTRKEVAKATVEGGEDTIVSFTDSINMNKVIRSYDIGTQGLFIVLDDFHEESRPEVIKNKSGNPAGVKNVKATFQSEVTLTEPSDIQRFRELTSIG